MTPRYVPHPLSPSLFISFSSLHCHISALCRPTHPVVALAKSSDSHFCSRATTPVAAAAVPSRNPQFVYGQELQIMVDEEKLFAAKEFFQVLTNYSNNHVMEYSKSIIPFNGLIIGNEEDIQKKKKLVNYILQEETFGPIASQARYEFLAQQRQVADSSPVDSEMLKDLDHDEF